MCILCGFIVGLLCSLGGALKDCPYEGFQVTKFPRSLLVGGFWGIVAYWVGYKVIDLQSFLLVICFCGYLERVTVEGYKILRAQRPGKFELKDPNMLGRKLGFSKCQNQS
jgi:hypothetical protein